MAKYITTSSSSSASSSVSNGIGFFGLFTIVLAALKLTGHAKISWWLVFLPVAIPFILLALIGIVVFAVLVFKK